MNFRTDAFNSHFTFNIHSTDIRNISFCLNIYQPLLLVSAIVLTIYILFAHISLSLSLLNCINIYSGVQILTHQYVPKQIGIEQSGSYMKLWLHFENLFGFAKFLVFDLHILDFNARISLFINQNVYVPLMCIGNVFTNHDTITITASYSNLNSKSCNSNADWAWALIVHVLHTLSANCWMLRNALLCNAMQRNEPKLRDAFHDALIGQTIVSNVAF